MKFAFFLFMLLFLFISAGCAHKQATTLKEEEVTTKQFSSNKRPKLGDFFLPCSGRVTLASLPHIIGNADYILIGETHDNAMHHQVQATLLSILAHNSIRRPILGLEMVPATMQSSINRFNYGQSDVKTLSEEVDWSTTWGFPFSLYRPVFTIASEMGTQVYGLNIDKVALDLARQIGLKKARKQLPKKFPQHVFPPHEVQVKALKATFEDHLTRMNGEKKRILSLKQIDKIKNKEYPLGKTIPPSTTASSLATQQINSAFARFLLVQSLWDSTMAENAVLLRKKTGMPILILAGSGHVEEFGIPWRIRMLDPTARIFTILPANISSRENKYQKADLYFYAQP